MKLKDEVGLKELTLTLIKVFNFKETEHNWNETAVIIKNISEFVSSNSIVQVGEYVSQIVSVLEKTVSFKIFITFNLFLFKVP